MKHWPIILIFPALITFCCSSFLLPQPQASVVVQTVEVVKEVQVPVPIAQGTPVAMIDEKPKEKIVFHEGDWDSLRIINAIAMYIVEHGYGYPVENLYVSVDTLKVYLPLGDLDVDMEVWRFQKQEWYDENVAAGRLIDLGAIYETSTQGWYVPRYVIEGDSKRGIEAMAPGLKSVDDLAKYWKVFQDPDDPKKGIWTNCSEDWSCYKIATVKADFYGLNEYYNAYPSKSQQDMDKRIVQAYERGNPILTHYWTPNWLLSKYDMVRLEEPEFNTSCWEEINEAIKEKPLGKISQACQFPIQDIHKGVHGNMLEKAPEVVVFIRKMFLGTKLINHLHAHMEDNEIGPEATAIYFLQEHENVWSRWVPSDVADRVKASLEQGK